MLTNLLPEDCNDSPPFAENPVQLRSSHPASEFLLALFQTRSSSLLLMENLREVLSDLPLGATRFIVLTGDSLRETLVRAASLLVAIREVFSNVKTLAPTSRRLERENGYVRTCEFRMRRNLLYSYLDSLFSILHRFLHLETKRHRSLEKAIRRSLRILFNPSPTMSPTSPSLHSQVFTSESLTTSLLQNPRLLEQSFPDLPSFPSAASCSCHDPHDRAHQVISTLQKYQSLLLEHRSLIVKPLQRITLAFHLSLDFYGRSFRNYLFFRSGLDPTCVDSIWFQFDESIAFVDGDACYSDDDDEEENEGESGEEGRRLSLLFSGLKRGIGNVVKRLRRRIGSRGDDDEREEEGDDDERLVVGLLERIEEQEEEEERIKQS